MNLAAFVARAQAAGIARVYKLGAVPAAPAYPYAVVSAALTPPSVRTLDGSGDAGGRVVVQHFGRTQEAVLDLSARTFAAFDGAALSGVDGDPVAWMEVASPLYRDPDDSGVLNLTHTYRY